MATETDWSAVIDEHAPPEDIIKALAAALDADTYTRDGRPVADHRTRLAAAQTLLLHRRGRPAEAPEPKSPAKSIDEEFADLKERAAHSPALRSLLRELGSLAEV
jgi:hypothetical protein